MKHFKKFASVALALVMVLALMAPAFATTTNSTQDAGNFKIIITVPQNVQDAGGSIAGQTYVAYKLFDVTYSNSNDGDDPATAGNYAYTLNSDFSGLVYNGVTYKTELEKGDNAATVKTGSDLVTLVRGMNAGQLKNFAAVVYNYATNKNLTPAASDTVPAGSETLELKPEEPGYYLVYNAVEFTNPDDDTDKQTVASCILTTTNPTAEMSVKPVIPTFEKTRDTASAHVGDYVKFKLESIVPNYAGIDDRYFYFIDFPSDGLEFITDATGEHAYSATIGGQAVGVTVTPLGIADADGKIGEVSYGSDAANRKGYKFEIAKGALDAADTGAAIVVEYWVKVSADAFSGNTFGNTAWGQYPTSNSGSNTTPPGSKPEYVFNIEVDKYEAGTSTKKLPGAEFVLKQNNKYYKLNKTEASEDGTTPETKNYVEWVDTEADATKFITDANGKLTFEGIAAGSYELVETKAPDGYNLLTAAIPIVITVKEEKVEGVDTTTITATVDGEAVTVKKSSDGTTWTATDSETKLLLTAQVANSTGSLLPSTGGIGTTIFYIVGGILVVGAVVLLITKRRTSVDDE